MFLKELFLDIHPSVVFITLQTCPTSQGSPDTCRTCSYEPQSGHHRAHIDVICILQTCFLGFLPAEQRLSCCTSVILSAPGMTGQHIHFPFNESTVFLLNIVSSEYKWKNIQITNKKPPFGVTFKPVIHKKLTSTGGLMSFSFTASHCWCP